MQQLDGTQVKLWNRNTHPYSEIFNGKLIEIPANEYVVMDYEEANRFMGKWCPIKKDKGGTPLPSSYKMLAIDPKDKSRAEAFLRNESEVKAKKTFVCHCCGEEFEKKKALIDHVKKKHMNDLADEKTREELEDEDS
jgi:hypothetical protein